MTFSTILHRTLLVAVFGLFLLTTTPVSGVLQDTSTPPQRDYAELQKLLEGDPQAYYLPGVAADNSALPPMDPQTTIPHWINIAFTSYRYNNADLFFYDFSNNLETQLTAAASTETDPSLNSGSTKLYFTSNQTGNAEVFVMDSNGQNQQPLTNHPAADFNAHISPDGTKIVFQSSRTGNSEIFVMNSDGSGVVQLTVDPDYDGYPNWSPNGSQIVYTSFSANNYDLWVMNVDGSGKRPLTAGAYTLSPTWSPDGTRIAYANDSDRNGFFELWVMQADGSGQQMLHSYGDNTIDGWKPSWSPDGNTIFYISTSWINYQNQWYWYQSFLIQYDLTGGSYPSTLLGHDDTIWEVHAQHNDLTAPSVCSVTAPIGNTKKVSDFILRWGSEVETGSGLGYSALQIREEGQTQWQTFSSNGPEYGQIYHHSTLTGAIEVRCQMCDKLNNCTDLAEAPIKTIEIEAARPNSTIYITSNYTSNPYIPLEIKGADIGQGIDYYSLYVKDGTEGKWEVWQTNITNPQLIFEGEPGHTYYFKSQAVDEVGHIEPWEPTADNFVVVAFTHLAGSVTDNRGNPAVATPIQLLPAAAFTPTLELPSAYQFLLGDPPTHTLTFQPAGYDPLPATVLTTTSNITFHLALAPEDNLLSNSHFETGDTAGWNSSGFTADTIYHTGAYGLALTQELTETAALTQTIVLTNTLHKPTLSLWYHIPVTLENRALIVSVQGISDTVQVISTTAATSGWVHAWADVSALAGQTVTVSIEATAGAGSVYLDEITLGSWYTPQITDVTPNNWLNTEPITLTITGSNFVATPTVWIAGVEMTNTTWVSSTELVVIVPAGVLSGQYFVEVQNPNGSANYWAEKVDLDPILLNLPFVAFQAPAVAPQVLGEDWLTLGHNPQRTSATSLDKGASDYQLRWVKEMPFVPGWTQELDQVVVADNIVVVMNREYSGPATIMALDAQTGNLRWQKNIEYVVGLSHASINYGQLYFFDASEGQIWSIDLYTGAESFKAIADYSASPLALLLVEDKIYVEGKYGSFTAYDAASGHLEWSTPAYGQNWAASYANNTIYTWYDSPDSTHLYRQFYAYHPQNGQIIWQNPLPLIETTTYGNFNFPVIHQNKAYVTSRNQLIAIDLTTGAKIWEKVSIEPTYGYEIAIPAVADNSVYIFNQGILEELDATTGALIWRSDLTNLRNAPVIAGNYLYVASLTHTYVINRTTHEIEWETPQGGWLTVVNGYLYIAQADNKLYAYQAEKP